ncbi:MAG: histidine kinase [Eubacteriales bacterium]|nr:histidine kinase [Eubacteriales bacterium]
MTNFNEMSLLNVSLLVFSALVTLFLLIGAITDMNRKSRFMSSFIILLISNILMQLGEAGIWFFAGELENIVLLNISAMMSMVFSYVLISAYAHCLTEFVCERKKVSFVPNYIILAICSIYILLSVISLFNGMFFSFDENGCFVNGPMYGLVRAFDLIVIIIGIFWVMCYRKILTLREISFLISFNVLPLLSMTLQRFWEPTPQYMAVTLSLIVIYVLFHGEITRQLADSRISIMLSQIQPHFMHNMLTTIMYMCRTEPEEAEKTVGQFADYLRANMDSLTLKQCIQFETELKHVKIYWSLEEKRFGDKIRAVYDIQENSFMLPSLTIQPIVENAVKHGMRKGKQLTVTIRTYSDVNNYYVEINDDGRGFDVNAFENDGKSHIGIKNVQQRIKMMCGGELMVNSVPDQGTDAVIKIPK